MLEAQRNFSDVFRKNSAGNVEGLPREWAKLDLLLGNWTRHVAEMLVDKSLGPATTLLLALK